MILLPSDNATFAPTTAAGITAPSANSMDDENHIVTDPIMLVAVIIAMLSCAGSLLATLYFILKFHQNSRRGHRNNGNNNSNNNNNNNNTNSRGGIRRVLLHLPKDVWSALVSARSSPHSDPKAQAEVLSAWLNVAGTPDPARGSPVYCPVTEPLTTERV